MNSIEGGLQPGGLPPGHGAWLSVEFAGRLVYALGMGITQEQAQEIEAQRSRSETTRRVVSPGLEALLYEPIEVLDHGFVRVIDYLGDDSAIVQAARVSYGTGTRSVRGDAALIAYLMRHRHTTPFEMCEIKYHVKLPVFVARQWIRHRTASINEVSARYSILDREFHIPAPDNLARQSTQNRQGRSDVLEGDEAVKVLEILKDDASRAYGHYEEMLDGEGPGLARELARINLPLGIYTQWYWKTNLHNLLHFLVLRADPHAQYEIRVYAEAMLETVKAWVPLAYEAFVECRLDGAELTAKQLAAVRRMVKGETVTQETSGLSRRMWEELQAVLESRP